MAFPDPRRILEEGDIISIDVGAIHKGFYGDAAVTLAIGDKVDEETQRLLETTEGALMAGIAKARAGQSFVERHPCHSVLCGATRLQRVA